MPTPKPGPAPITTCPECGRALTPHCKRAAATATKTKAPPCGWLNCQPCNETFRAKDMRRMPDPADANPGQP